MNPLLVLALTALNVATPSPSASLASPEDGAARRFALVIGESTGGPDRLTLHYAAADARSVWSVLTALGGFEAGDASLLLEPSGADVRIALSEMAAKIASANAAGVRTEVLVYYSGHSDDDGLLLGADKLTYRELRAAVEKLPAAVRIAILDSCSSGVFAQAAFTRAKGGVRRPAFLLDTSSRVRGHAFLTSSAADESAQESDIIGASYFTHALVSGLYGAADVSHDGRVSLTEAYQFAFQETLSRSEKSALGSQHPAYAIDLQGTGDFVMTDLHKASSTLRLPAALDGRVFLRDADGNLVAELKKIAGREVELGLPAGNYRVVVETDADRFAADVALPSGAAVSLADVELARVPGEPVTARGPTAEERAAREKERVRLAERVYEREKLRVEKATIALGAGAPFTSFVGDSRIPLEATDFFDRLDRPDLKKKYEEARDSKDLQTWGGIAGAVGGIGLALGTLALLVTLPGVSDAGFLVGLGFVGAGLLGGLVSDGFGFAGLLRSASPIEEPEARALVEKHNAKLREKLNLTASGT